MQGRLIKSLFSHLKRFFSLFQIKFIFIYFDILISKINLKIYYFNLFLNIKKPLKTITKSNYERLLPLYVAFYATSKSEMHEPIFRDGSLDLIWLLFHFNKR
jgi:hypothetical protein